MTRSLAACQSHDPKPKRRAPDLVVNFSVQWNVLAQIAFMMIWECVVSSEKSTDRVEHFREAAAQARGDAHRAATPELQTAFIELAIGWESLAAELDRFRSKNRVVELPAEEASVAPDPANDETEKRHSQS